MLTDGKYCQYILTYPYRTYNELYSSQSLAFFLFLSFFLFFFLENNFIFFEGVDRCLVSGLRESLLAASSLRDFEHIEARSCSRAGAGPL